MSFETLGLSAALVGALTQAGFTEPTPVQARAIPDALAGHDLMVSSQTGSGKTAAFMLPALERMIASGDSPLRTGGVRVLVLTPTRELAQQVAQATRTYGQQMRTLNIVTVVGGVPYGAQLRQLSRRVDVLVATPGRLLDHLQAGRVDLGQVQTLVLDEADRMLDMGFIEAIEAIVAQTNPARQTLLFSATLDGTVARLASAMMRDPRRLELATQHARHDSIAQNLYYADDVEHKTRLLDHVLRDAQLEQAIVFTATKRGADDLAGHLSEQGHTAAALHGDMNQRQRNRTLARLHGGQVRVLVATDVAARGIDVQGISHVVNFDLPMHAEDYVHRIGRTGRAGRSGQAFTLATHSERHKVRRIEKFTGQALPPAVVAGLEPRRAERPTGGRGRPGGGGRPFAPRRDWQDGPSAGAHRPEGRFESRGPGRFENRGEQADRRPAGSRDWSERAPRPEGDRPAWRGAREAGSGYAPRPDAGRERPAGWQGQERREGDARPAYRGDRPAFGDRGGFREGRPAPRSESGGGYEARSNFRDAPRAGGEWRDSRPRRDNGAPSAAPRGDRPFQREARPAWRDDRGARPGPSSSRPHSGQAPAPRRSRDEG